MKFYIGTYTMGRSSGIYLGSIHTDFLRVEPWITTEDCSYIATHENYLFSLARNGIKIFEEQSLIYEDHSFTENPSHITYIDEYQMILIANFRLGHIVSYHFKGRDTSIVEVISYPFGQSHAHQVYYHDNRIYVCDLGLDKVFVYEIQENRHLKLIQELKLPLRTGPRHLVISNQKIVYVLTEFSNEIYCYDWHGVLIHNYHTIPFNYIKADSSAIKLSHDEKHLYALNRTTDYISHFVVKFDGGLELMECYPTEGRHARDFDISKDDRYLVIANQHTSNLTLFERDLDNGSLTLLHKEHPVPDPTSILFI